MEEPKKPEENDGNEEAVKAIVLNCGRIFTSGVWTGIQIGRTFLAEQIRNGSLN